MTTTTRPRARCHPGRVEQRDGLCGHCWVPAPVFLHLSTQDPPLPASVRRIYRVPPICPKCGAGALAGDPAPLGGGLPRVVCRLCTWDAFLLPPDNHAYG